MPIMNTGVRSNTQISAPAAEVKKLGGTIISSGTFYTAQFDNREDAETFSAWLKRRYYQARTTIAPDAQCNFFLVPYR